MEQIVVTGKTYRDCRILAAMITAIAKEAGYSCEKRERGDMAVVTVANIYEITFFPLVRFIRQYPEKLIEAQDYWKQFDLLRVAG